MSDLYLSYTEYRDGGEVREGDEDEAFPNYEDTHIDWYLTKCLKSKRDKPWPAEIVSVGFDPTVGDDVHVVYVRYTTGCTFGTIYGAWHIVGVYQNIEDAEAIRKSIDNETYEGYRPWVGYFESIESCGVQTMKVQP